MPAPDYGHQETDRELAALIRRIHQSYSTAIEELQKKIDDYMEQFEKQDAYYRALFDSGEMDYADFIKWRRTAVIETQQWKNMRDQLAFDLTHQNEIAASMISDALPDIYALNYNFGTYEAEVGSGIDTTYTMYNRFTAARLMRDNEYVLPTINEPKDMAWNKQLIQSSVLQGILQGEPMKDIAGRFERVVGMTESAAMRNARTAVTGAENSGRVDSYKRAEKMGIKMQQVWMATLDDRTRDSHAMLDGERRDIGKEFSNGCRYPGDPKGDPSEIYNCRCTLIGLPEGSTYDPSDMSERYSDYLEKHGMSYEEWKEMHRKNIEHQETDTFDRNEIIYSRWGKELVQDLTKAGVEYNEVRLLEKHLTEEEIINRVGGGDKTTGSCVSLACSYIGNKNGLDVLDFRDGASLDIISRNTLAFCRLNDVESEFGFRTSIKTAVSYLDKVEEGKEYMYAVGNHCAIVRRSDGILQYLELQSATKNGWKNFEHEEYISTGRKKKFSIADTLKSRFEFYNGGDISLIDIQSLRDSDEFRDILGYINTNPDQQNKGVGGFAK